jgi:hypothetical protein
LCHSVLLIDTLDLFSGTHEFVFKSSLTVTIWSPCGVPTFENELYVSRFYM